MATCSRSFSKPALRCWSSPWASGRHCRTPPFFPATGSAGSGAGGDVRGHADYGADPGPRIPPAPGGKDRAGGAGALASASDLPPKSHETGRKAFLRGRAPGRGDTPRGAAHSIVARADRTQPGHAPADAARRRAGAGILVAPAAAGCGDGGSEGGSGVRPASRRPDQHHRICGACSGGDPDSHQGLARGGQPGRKRNAAGDGTARLGGSAAGTFWAGPIRKIEPFWRSPPLPATPRLPSRSRRPTSRTRSWAPLPSFCMCW